MHLIPLGYTSSMIVSSWVYADDRNSSWRAIFLDQPSLGLSREYLIKGFEDEDVQVNSTILNEGN